MKLALGNRGMLWLLLPAIALLIVLAIAFSFSYWQDSLRDTYRKTQIGMTYQEVYAIFAATKSDSQTVEIGKYRYCLEERPTSWSPGRELEITFDIDTGCVAEKRIHYNDPFMWRNLKRWLGL